MSAIVATVSENMARSTVGPRGRVGMGLEEGGGALRTESFISGPEMCSSSCDSYAKACDPRLAVGLLWVIF